MAYGRILVVDDLPDVRATVIGTLTDEGYQVWGAATYEEALQLLQQNRFHVAVLDVRLEESDVENEAGLQLMHHIRQIDETIATIILTGHAEVPMVQEALQPNQDGISPAFSFLEKSEMNLLPKYVSRAFERAVRFNQSLEIDDVGQVIPELAKRLRFQNRAKPDLETLAEEINELLGKLFFECTRIQIQAPQRGYSSAAVFKIVPWYHERGQGEIRIVKIGERGVADQEVALYRKYVAGVVGGFRVPTTVDTVQTRSLSGILYTFAGLGAAQEFSIFFEEASTEEVRTVVRNLYSNTCLPWQRDAALSPGPVDLKETFFKLLWLNSQRMERALAQMMGKRHPFHLGEDDRVWLNDEFPLINPVKFVQAHRFQLQSLMGIIHGDLQGYNVLVDQFQETWLIDFARTTRGPVSQDYVLFETYLLISAVAHHNWHTMYQWYRVLFETENMTAVPLPAELRQTQDIWKAHTAVLTIRRLAFGDAVILSENEYLVSLLFNALKLITILNLPATQRDYALIVSALVAERLANGGALLNDDKN